MSTVDYDDNESKLLRKAKENPFVPAGKPLIFIIVIISFIIHCLLGGSGGNNMYFS